jgi:hypothetical protein
VTLSRLTIGSRILAAILFTAALATVISVPGIAGVRSIQRSMATTTTTEESASATIELKQQAEVMDKSVCSTPGQLPEF